MAYQGLSTLALDEANELVANGGLADARLTRERNKTAVATDGRLESCAQSAQFSFAADEGWPLR
jgi:hypothetical protein